MEVEEYIKGKVEYDEYGGSFVWDEDMHMILDIRVRGWGRIQNLVNGQEEAEELQDKVGRWIAEAINEKLKR